MRKSIGVMAFGASGALSISSFGAIVTILPDAGSFHSPTTNVTFDMPPAGAAFTYTEAGLTVANTSQLQFGTGGAYPGDYRLNTYQSMTYSFARPVTEVGWDEFFGSNTTARLYKDADGTQLLGEYSIGISTVLTTTRFHGFASDTPFQRMVLTGSALTVTVNNLRHTPEPTMMLGACGFALLWASRGLLGRRRQSHSN